VLRGAPGAIAGEAAGWLNAQGLVVERWSARDAYVETAWYDTVSKGSARGRGDPSRLLTSIKIRVWADPGAPGQTRLTTEAVYRPTFDPSQPPRDEEVPVPPKSWGLDLLNRLRTALGERLGLPNGTP
jgi:hypothetical protein